MFTAAAFSSNVLSSRSSSPQLRARTRKDVHLSTSWSAGHQPSGLLLSEILLLPILSFEQVACTRTSEYPSTYNEQRDGQSLASISQRQIYMVSEELAPCALTLHVEALWA
jgi:hypothetical protein